MTTTYVPEPWDNTVWNIAARITGQSYAARPGISFQREKAMHPAIAHILFNLRVRPWDWQQLLLEWPRAATDGPHVVEYTRSEADMASLRVTPCPLGKYLSKHWPDVPSSVRRDWASQYKADEYTVVNTTDEIVKGVELGPKSCMQSTHGTIPFSAAEVSRWLNDPDEEDEPDWGTHPYAVYKPEFGWSMALRKSNGRIMGRAMLHTSESGRRTYVRTYLRHATDPAGYSYADNTLEAWLAKHGWERACSWSGAKLGRMEHDDGGLMVPYLDGSPQRVRACVGYLRVDEYGELKADSTSARVNDVEEDDEEDDEEDSVGYCEDCEGNIREGDDYSHVGRDEDRMVCMGCCDRNYTAVMGTGGSWNGYREREYYIENDEAIEVDGEYYDPENLPEGIVRLEDGEYAKLDDVAIIDGGYYLTDDERVVSLVEEHPDTGDIYALKEDCWEDFEGGWWPDCVECIEVDGENYTEAQLEQVRADAQVAQLI